MILRFYKADLSKFIRYSLTMILILVTVSLLNSCSSQNTALKPKSVTFNKSNSENIFETLDTTTMNRITKDIVFKAATYQMQYRFADAIIEYEDALRYDSTSSIYYAISKCYRDLNKFDKAEDYALKAHWQKPDNIDYLELLAEIYTAKRDLQQAVTIYKRVIDLKPTLENKLNYAKLCEYYDVKIAIDEYEKLYKDNNDPYIVSRLLDLYDEAGYFAKKAELITKLEDSNQLNIETSKQLLNQYITQAKFPEAFNLIEKIEKRVSINENIEIYKIFLSQLTMPKYFKNNINILPKVVKKIDSRFKFDVYMQFCGAYLSYALADTVKGEEYINSYLELTDTASNAIVTVASVYSEYNHIDKAEKILKKYENKNLKNINYLLFLADINTKLNKYAESNSYVNQILAFDNKNVPAYQIYYLNLDKQGLKDSSREIAKKIYELNPKDPVSNNNYAYSLAEDGKDLNKAQELIGKAIKEDPNNANFLDTNGWILFKLGENDAALEYIKKSISLDSTNYESFLHLGDIYFEIGDIDSAKKAWLRGLEIDKNNDILIRRLKKIKN